jgi:hypothetical protein
MVSEYSVVFLVVTATHRTKKCSQLYLVVADDLRGTPIQS